MPETEPTLATLFLLTAHTCIAALCLWSFGRERQEPRARTHPWLWLILAVPVFVLGLHHATGFGSELTDVFRQEARAEGWYSARRIFQGLAIRAILALAGGALITLLWLLRKEWRRYAPAALALVLLSGFGAVQLVSLHFVDASMRSHFLGIRLETWLNLAGLGLATVGLAWSYREGLRLHRRPSRLGSHAGFRPR